MKLLSIAALALVLGFAVPAAAQTNTSTIDQIGTGDTATVTQSQPVRRQPQPVRRRSGRRQRGDLTQTGRNNDNISTVNQATNNQATVVQRGRDNDEQVRCPAAQHRPSPTCVSAARTTRASRASCRRARRAQPRHRPPARRGQHQLLAHRAEGCGAPTRQACASAAMTTRTPRSSRRTASAARTSSTCFSSATTTQQSTITQDGMGGGNKSTVTQDGTFNANTSLVTQGSEADRGLNDVIVRQEGDQQRQQLSRSRRTAPAGATGPWSCSGAPSATTPRRSRSRASAATTSPGPTVRRQCQQRLADHAGRRRRQRCPVLQHGVDAENNSTISQTGSVTGGTRRRWTRAAANIDNFSDIAQTGDGNNAQVYQYDNHVYGSLLSNKSTITQNGNNNNAIVNQH